MGLDGLGVKALLPAGATAASGDGSPEAVSVDAEIALREVRVLEFVGVVATGSPLSGDELLFLQRGALQFFSGTVGLKLRDPCGGSAGVKWTCRPYGF